MDNTSPSLAALGVITTGTIPVVQPPKRPAEQPATSSAAQATSTPPEAGPSPQDEARQKVAEFALMPGDGPRAAMRKLEKIIREMGVHHLLVKAEGDKIVAHAGDFPGMDMAEIIAITAVRAGGVYSGHLTNTESTFTIDLPQVNLASTQRASRILAQRRKVDELFQRTARGFILALGPTMFGVAGALTGGQDLLVTTNILGEVSKVRVSPDPQAPPNPRRPDLVRVPAGEYTHLLGDLGVAAVLQIATRMFAGTVPNVVYVGHAQDESAPVLLA